MADLAACECLLCVDYGDRDQYNDSDRDIIGSVTEYGWSALGIGPTSPEESPPFAYTVGLWHTMRLPELAIYGVNDIAMMQRALNAVAKQAQEGRVLQVGETFADVLALPDVDDYRVKLSPSTPVGTTTNSVSDCGSTAPTTCGICRSCGPTARDVFPGTPNSIRISTIGSR